MSVPSLRSIIDGEPDRGAGGFAQKTPAIGILDASYSMRDYIDEINRDLTMLRDDLAADPATASQCDLAVIEVGGDVRVSPFQSAANFVPPVLRASGGTPLVQATETALNVIREYRRQHDLIDIDVNRIFGFVITDADASESMTEIRRVGKLVRDAHQEQLMLFHPVVVENCHAEKLALLFNMRPKLLGQCRLKEFFDWVKKSVRLISMSRPGEKVKLPSTENWESF